MQPTQYPDINHLLDDLLSSIRTILSEKLVGLYLFGSLVWGDFDHDTSDIDLLAATATDIDDQEAAALKAMHDELAHTYKEWDNRIEVKYLSLLGLKTFRSQTTRLAVISPGEPFHLVDAGKDRLLNWYFVQEKGVTLFGPSPRTLIDPISRDEFIRAVVDQARQWPEWILEARHSRPSQSYAILTMCRALYAYKNGEQVSKKQAALWAQKELPQYASLIQSALEWRLAAKLNEPIDHQATYPQARRFVNYVSALMPAD